jgi:hypothetical protein
MPNDKNPAAVALVSLRRIVDGTCLVCRAPIRGTVRRRYCSNACKMRAKGQRKKAAT